MATPQLPFFELTINEDDDTGVSFNAMVDVPAHMKNFVAFGAKAMHYFEDEGKRMVLGVMISAGTPIYRNATKEAPEHNVIFKADTVRAIAKKFHLNQLGTAVNEMHDPSKVVAGVTMVESYTIGGDRSPTAPKVFEALNLQDGSWIGQYFVENDEVWLKVLSGEFKGFSVEGLFEMEPIEVKKQEMKKKKFNLFGFTFGPEVDDDQQQQKFVEVTTTDGIVLSYDGELAAGTPIFLVVEGGDPVPAEAGAYLIDVDGSGMTVNVDENGLITSVDAVDKDMTDEEMAAVPVTAGDLKDFMNEFKAELDKQLKVANDVAAAQGVELAAARKELKHMQAFNASKHNYVALKANEPEKGKGGYKAILKAQRDKLKNK